jgi:predicted SnoaL-like aldol condensation-catalyzing enzyme
MHRFLALYAEAWAQPTSGRLVELWAQDAEMMHPELEEPIRGRDAVMAYLRWFLEMAPDLTVRPLAAAANGDTLFIHFRSQATIAGEKLVWEGVDRYDLKGDQGVYGIGFFDTTALRRALAGERQ